MTVNTTLPALGTADFDRRLIATRQPLLVEFWATGCGPCQALMPILADLAADHAGLLRVATVKLDDAPELARRYQIMALPTLILFTDGCETRRITTATTKAALVDQLADTLHQPH
ncbi:thioredoxin family protein [Actinomadura kijaniata]|uniref:thioredoxin family protein n=1 Tax=Actinomadura kijaniata TaxID=46161 RepID=UPI0008318D52|nr:thioredoxin family protein [Actinomadura kijaniata]